MICPDCQGENEKANTSVDTFRMLMGEYKRNNKNFIYRRW